MPERSKGTAVHCRSFDTFSIQLKVGSNPTCNVVGDVPVIFRNITSRLGSSGNENFSGFDIPLPPFPNFDATSYIWQLTVTRLSLQLSSHLELPAVLKLS